MTIDLPEELQLFIRAEVHSGHFASEEDAVAEAVRLLRSQLGARAAAPALAPTHSALASPPDPVLGAMREAADEMDEIIADAMKQREAQPWRLSSSE